MASRGPSAYGAARLLAAVVLGLGTWELLLVGVALLLLFGPEQAPRTMHTLGRWQGRVRGMLQDLEQGLEREVRGPIELPKLPPPEDGDGSIPADRD